MFSSGPSYSKLKTNLRLAINRLKLLEKKKTELAQKARKEIADYISSGKSERAKIRVEHIIREDYIVEAMEVTEMYCDLLLARFGLIEQMKDLDDGLSEAISSLIWVAPRLQTDVQELKVIADQLGIKYGKPYAQACREGQVTTLSEKLKHKLSVQAPPKILVENYLIEIAKNYNIEYEPDPQIMRESAWATDPLINLGDGSNDLGGQGGASGGGGGGMNIPPVGFSQPGSDSHPFNYPPISMQMPPPYMQDNYPNLPPNMHDTHGQVPPTFAPSIFLTNPQSLANSFKDFAGAMKQYQPDVAAVAETWFSSKNPAKNYRIDNYELFHDDRDDRRGGGVALYIRGSLRPYEPTIKVATELECVWAGIGPALFICTLYNPPRSTCEKLLLDHLVNTVLDLRKRIPNCKVILIGDFNQFPHERLFSSLRLRNLVHEPTHQNSAIDLILTDMSELYGEPRLLKPIGRSQHHCVLATPLQVKS